MYGCPYIGFKLADVINTLPNIVIQQGKYIAIQLYQVAVVDIIRMSMSIFNNGCPL